jgi:hypothetical protein
MPGLVPGIHVLEARTNKKTWMGPGHPRDEVPEGGHDQGCYAAAMLDCATSGSFSQITRLRPLRLAA